MRALEYVMRGRVCAVILMLLGIPLLSPAILGLIGLRRGPIEGLLLLAWALLPLVVASVAGYISPLMLGLAVTHLSAVWFGALVLRQSGAWSKTLIALTTVAAIGILLTSHFSGGVMSSLLEVATTSGGPTTQLQQVFGSEHQVTGYLTLISAITATLALLLGRWWQSLLYNPGGLRPELHQLQVPLPVAIIGMLLWVYGLTSGHYVFWGAVAAFPSIVAGIALIHWLIAKRNWGKGPLIALYVMLVIVALPAAGFLCALALTDSWIDIRARSGNKG
ncbi:MAG: hypothetical protein K0U59_12070 [Gammaproteobacteria bacterium]|nr:hypothetical protein [Gammaproteobacteria bacterium]